MFHSGLGQRRPLNGSFPFDGIVVCRAISMSRWGDLAQEHPSSEWSSSEQSSVLAAPFTSRHWCSRVTSDWITQRSAVRRDGSTTLLTKQ